MSAGCRQYRYENASEWQESAGGATPTCHAHLPQAEGECDPLQLPSRQVHHLLVHDRLNLRGITVTKVRGQRSDPIREDKQWQRSEGKGHCCVTTPHLQWFDDVGDKLRVDVRVTNLVVQQLSHGAGKLGADLLRLVAHVHQWHLVWRVDKRHCGTAFSLSI